MIDLRKKDAMVAAIEEILQQEALKGNQHKIDKNKNNKIDAEDFKLLRKEENVDEALKGNQHKIDKNKNNKIDAEDFKMLRKEESVEEGIKDIAKKAFKALTGGSDEDQRKNLQRKMGLPQTGKKPEPQKEEVEQIDEKNVPTSPEKWARAKAAAKSKFAVYPSAYANGWASKKYKSMGGGWRSTSEEVELDEGKEESKKDFDDRQKRLAAASAETAKDPKRLERMSKIPGYSAAMDLAKKTTKEEVEQIDELSKSTLGSYAKKASRDAVITRKIGADFERKADAARSPGMKAASNEISQKYKEKSWKRRDGLEKAVDRLTKEEKQPKTLRQFKEGWEEMMADVKKRAEPKPNGGSGVKQGSRYGGSKQKDKPEQETDEKK